MKYFQLLLFIFLFINQAYSSANKCDVHELLVEVAGSSGKASSRSLSDLVADLGVLAKINHQVVDTKAHSLLVDISKLSPADQKIFLDTIENSADFKKLDKDAQSLLKMAAMDADEWKKAINKYIKSTDPTETTIFTGDYGVYGSLFYALQNISPKAKESIEGAVKYLYHQADRSYGEIKQREVLRQLVLAINKPYHTFKSSSEPIAQAYIKSMEQNRSVLKDTIGELDSEVPLQLAKHLQRTMNWSKGDVNEIVFVGSLPNGFAHAGKSDIDVHFVKKSGAGFSQNDKKNIINEMAEDIYMFTVSRRLGNMPLADEVDGDNFREFFGHNMPFSFRIFEDKLILRANKPKLKINADGTKNNNDTEFEEFELSLD